MVVDVGECNRAKRHWTPEVRAESTVSDTAQGERVFLLEEISPGSTRLAQKEDFSGIAIPFASPDAIEESHNQMNQVLKIRAEMQ